MTHAPGFRADDAMSGAKFRVVREYLGLTTAWMAEHLDVAERTVHRWEAGVMAVPDGVRLQVHDWECQTAHVVTRGITDLVDQPHPTIGTYRTDADYRRDNPGCSWTAGWHRAATARIAQEVPGLAIYYHP